MNEQLNNILYWVSFVGVAIFIVNSIHSTIVLRHIKNKEFKSPDLMFTSVTLTMAIMFTALSVSTQLHHTHPELTKPQSNTPMIELHQAAGTILQYNAVTKKYDTVQIFIRKKDQ